MNKWLKILCLVLVLAFILPAIVACDNEKTPDEGNNGGDDGVILETPDKLDGTRYDGSTFTIYSLGDMFTKKFFFADKTTGDGMNDTIYQRQQTIKKLLGVELIYKEAENSGEAAAYTLYGSEVKNAIKSGTEKYQMVGTHTYYSIPDLITTGSLKDFKEFESVDLSKDYWNQSIMDQVEYKGHYYLGYSDYNLAATYVVGYNKSLYNEFESAFNGNSMYDYVNNNQWTLAKLSEVAAYVYKDEGDPAKNTYGLSGEVWVPFCGFLQSSGETIVAKNKSSGKYELTWYENTTISTKLNNLIEQMKDIRDMKEVHFWLNTAHQSYGDTTALKLASGKVFMEFMQTGELIAMKDTQIKFGVVPYPMYDEDQAKTTGYRSLNWAGFIAVPANVSNVKMVSDVLECIAFYSEDVVTYYYEKLLGLKVSEAPDDAKMLDIVWAGVCTDFGLVYGMIDTNVTLDSFVYSVPNCIMQDSTFAKLNAQKRRAAQNVLNTYINDK